MNKKDYYTYKTRVLNDQVSDDLKRLKDNYEKTQKLIEELEKKFEEMEK